MSSLPDGIKEITGSRVVLENAVHRNFAAARDAATTLNITYGGEATDITSTSASGKNLRGNDGRFA